MSKSKENTTKKPSKFWIVLAISLLMNFIVVQVPISWVVQKFLPNNSYILWTTGNVWHGSANLQIPSTNPSKNRAMVNGTVTWELKPLKVFLGKAYTDVEIISGKTKLKGEMALGNQSVRFIEMTGRVDTDTIKSFAPVDMPNAPIQFNKVSLGYDKEDGFTDADGQITWVGGMLSIANMNNFSKINLPTMQANLAVVDSSKQSSVKTDAKNSLHIHLMDNDKKTLGNLYLDNLGMVDVSITQRMLEDMPSYTGSAPKDTTVFSLRQPLTSFIK